MKNPTWLLAGAAILVLGACGKQGGSGTNPSAPAAETGAKADEHKGPEFSESLKKPNCMLPGPSATPASGFDLGGVKLGMGREEAVRVIFCGGKQKFNYIASTSFFNTSADESKLGPQTVGIHNGVYGECDPNESDPLYGPVGGRCRFGELYFRNISDDLFLATPGLPGQERVLGVWRAETFVKAPVIATVLESLGQKFGEPSKKVEDGGDVSLTWQWGKDGQLLKPGGQEFSDCASNLAPTAGAGSSFYEGCGLSVRAVVYRAADNAELATGYAVAMMNQDKTYAALMAMKNALASEEAAKQQQQLNDAKAGGEKPEF